jgi:hypothetical protein
MPHLADWFLGHPNNKEGIDLPCLRSNNSNLAQGQMCNKLHREAVIIVVSIAGVQTISSGTVRDPRNLTKDKVPIKVIKTKGKRPMMQVRQGRINFTTLAELPDGVPIMSGTFSIHHQPVVTLFDSGATHSFISNNCGTRIGLDPCPTQGSYMISTPGGKITSNQMVKSVPIRLGSQVIKTDLVLLNLEGIDVILGTNWMTEHRVLLDISSRVIRIDSPYQGAITLYLPQ